MIEVDALKARLRARGEDVNARTLDNLVEALGGRREAMIDLWSLPVRAFDWLRGRGWRSSDVYVLPVKP